MNRKNMYKGLVIGTILPIIFGVLIKLVFYKYISIKQLLNPTILSPFVQYGIIANLLIFYYFMIKNKQEYQKGIVLPTLIYVIIAMYLKYYN